MSRKFYAALLAVVLVGAGGIHAWTQPPATKGKMTPSRDSNGGVQQSDGTVVVSDISAPPTLKMGGTITVEATVTNTGTDTVTRTAQYMLAGERYQERTVTLGPNESTTVKFEQNTMGIGLETGGYYTGVLVGAHGDMSPVTFRKGYDVDNIDYPDTVTAGEEFVIDAEVKNYNQFDDQQVLEYRLDGDVLARKSLALESDEEVMTSIRVDTTGVEPGTYVHGITANGSGSHGTITVESGNG